MGDVIIPSDDNLIVQSQTVGWKNLPKEDKALVDGMAREIANDMALSMERGEDVAAMRDALRAAVEAGGMSGELVGWWINENRRDVEPCGYCGLREEPVQVPGEWPHCPECKGV